MSAANECHGDADIDDIHGKTEIQANTNTIISASVSVMSLDTLSMRSSKYCRSRPKKGGIFFPDWTTRRWMTSLMILFPTTKV
jgi:hypothetical protein